MRARIPIYLQCMCTLVLHITTIHPMSCSCSNAFLCDCEVGLVTTLQLSRNNVSVTLPAALEALSPLQCSLKSIIARWNPIIGEVNDIK